MFLCLEQKISNQTNVMTKLRFLLDYERYAFYLQKGTMLEIG